MMRHPSRPLTAEFIGVRRENGSLINVDGTSPSYEPLLTGDLQQAAACLNLRINGLPVPFSAGNCSEAQPGYICETSLRCLHGLPCPAGWMALDDYCYHHVSTAMTVPDADQHCSALQPGARISPVINMGIWSILYKSCGTGSDMFVGITYQAAKNSFQSVDGTAWSIVWRPGEPSGGGRGEDCVVLGKNHANDISCSIAVRFICRAPRNLC